VAAVVAAALATYADDVKAALAQQASTLISFGLCLGQLLVADGARARTSQLVASHHTATSRP
jgi:hypothetical protein